MQAGRAALATARRRLHPVETLADQGEAPPFGQIGEVAHADLGILEMGGQDGEVVRVERHESQWDEIGIDGRRRLEVRRNLV